MKREARQSGKEKTASPIKKRRRIKLDKIRRPIQIVLGIAIMVLLRYGYVSLGLLVIIGSVLGIFLGKIFCRWGCPIGVLMELLLTTTANGRTRGMYQYHKLGCPIAWISGILNRMSLFSVEKDRKRDCTECGACDDACYITKVDSNYSLFKKDLENPADAYACSRCMACVDACPTQYIGVRTRRP